MLVRLAVRDSDKGGRRDGEPDDEETKAATRIQSLYRGRKARQDRKMRRGSFNLKEPVVREGREGSKNRLPVEGDGAGAAGGSTEATFGSSAGASSSPGGLLKLPASEGSDPSKGISSSSMGEYITMRNELEATPTDLPRWLQQWRISAYMLFEEPRSSYAAQVLSIFILVMIIISIVCFMAETMPELKHVPENLWLSVEVCCTGVFTVEYLTRLASCSVAGIHPLQFLKSTMNIFDLLAILPFYMSVAMQNSEAKALGVLRTVRLVRLFRIFKLGRYSVGLRLMAQALKNSAQALWVLCFFLCVGILLFSSAVYYVEKMECPDVDDLKVELHRLDPKGGLTEWDRYVADCRAGNSGKHIDHGLCCDEYGSPLDFPSIVEAFWWSTVTMTTVGFGEVYPRTELGRIIATATMLSGILLIALPVAIIGRKFQEVYEDRDREDLKGESSMPFRPASPNDDPVAPLGPGASAEPGAGSPKRVDIQPSGASAQVSDVPAVPIVKAPEGPSLIEMSRRLRLMKLPDIGMTSTALELAEELEEACDMQQEISSMEREEKARREEVVDIFDGLLKRFGELLNPEEDAKKAKTAGWGAFGGPSKLTMLMFKKDQKEGAAGGAPAAGGAAAPPLPPPLDPPPSDELGKQPVAAEASQAAALPPGMVEAA